jgi:hypothetical protein
LGVAVAVCGVRGTGIYSGSGARRAKLKRIWVKCLNGQRAVARAARRGRLFSRLGNDQKSPMQQHWPAGRKARPRLLRHPCRDPAFLRRDVPYTNGTPGTALAGRVS